MAAPISSAMIVTTSMISSRVNASLFRFIKIQFRPKQVIGFIPKIFQLNLRGADGGVSGPVSATMIKSFVPTFKRDTGKSFCARNQPVY